MCAVAVELRPLMLMRGVFDGECVQTELFFDFGQPLAVGGAEIEPDEDAGVIYVLGDVGDGEVLFLQHSVAIEASARHQTSVANVGGSCSVARRCAVVLRSTTNDRNGTKPAQTSASMRGIPSR